MTTPPPLPVRHHVESTVPAGTAAKRLKSKVIFPRPRSTLPILPYDLVLEILLRLPVRTLLQFKRVCNSWKTLISSSQFANNHLQRSAAADATDPRWAYPLCHCRNHHLVRMEIGFCSLQSMFKNPSSLNLNCIEVNSRFLQILGSCNGLLCLWEFSPSRARLWNPCTNQFSSKWVHIESDVIIHRGFGYDHVHDTYKLLVIVPGDSIQAAPTTTRVYSFGDDSWTTIQNFPFLPDHGTTTFVSGTLNWIARVPGTTNQWQVFSVDLATLAFRQMSLPYSNSDDDDDDGGDSDCNPVLLVLRNCLCVCFDENKTHWVVWMMKEYGAQQSWTKLSTISYAGLPPTLYPLKPLYVFGDDAVLAMSKSLPSKLVLYNYNEVRR